MQRYTNIGKSVKLVHPRKEVFEPLCNDKSYSEPKSRAPSSNVKLKVNVMAIEPTMGYIPWRL